MFGNLLKAAVGVVLTPVDVAADALTLGGLLTDRETPYTSERIKDVYKNLKQATSPNGK